MSEIATRVTSIITDKLGVEESQVVPEASFTNDLGADSLDTSLRKNSISPFPTRKPKRLSPLATPSLSSRTQRSNF